MSNLQQATAEHKVIHYTVDGEDQETRERELTPNEILRKAEVDPATHYLVEIRGRERISYQDRGDEPIRLHQGAKFVSVFVGPTPVS